MRPPRHVLIAGALVAIVAAAGLALTSHPARDALPRGRAIALALGDSTTRQDLAGTGWTRVSASPVDGTLERVAFFHGAAIVAQVAVSRSGEVEHQMNLSKSPVPYGNWIAYEPALLVLLSAVFVLVTAVLPLRRARNLDVLAALSLLVPVLLLQRRFIGASTVAAAPGLVYLAARCLRVALGGGEPASPGTPLFDVLTRGADGVQRTRILRLLVVALAVIFLCVGVSSSAAVDVIYAVMEGATTILHGVLPYGHLPGDVVHGDTYPLLSYALYVPVAWLSPVQSSWDSVDLALLATVLTALGAAGLVHRAVAGPRPERDGARRQAGLRAAIAWLTFPPLLITVSTGTTDVMLALLLLAAVLLWPAHGRSSGVLIAAGWFKLAPFALVPLWLAAAREGRWRRAAAATAAVSAPLLVLLLALGGVSGVHAMLHAISYQFTRGSDQSVWAALGVPGLQPLGEGCVLGVLTVLAGSFASAPDAPVEPRRLAAACAAVLAGLQLAANYWAFLYLTWLVPLWCVSLLSSPSVLAVAATEAAVVPAGAAIAPA